MLFWSGTSSSQHASGQISLNYEGATEGLNPNGTRYSIHELTSDDLLKEVLLQMGLTDYLDSGDLFVALSAYPVNSQSVDQRYISSEYVVKLDLEKKLPFGITADAVLDRLLMLYHRDFVNRFGRDDSSLDINWELAEEMEYFEFGSMLQSHIKNLSHYLDNLIEESGTAQYRIEGESFRSLLHSVNVFENIYLNKYIAFVQEKHLFRNVSEYYNKLVYQRMLLNQRYRQAKTEYEIRRNVTDKYDKHMIAFVMVPMFDAKNGLYMSRTKIGIDNYTIGANTYSISSGALAKSIDEIDANMDRTRQTGQNTDDFRKADGMIDNIIIQMDKLVQRIRDAAQRYEDYRSKTDMRYSIKSRSAMQIFNVKRNVLYTCGFAVVLCLLFIIWDQYRGARKS